MKLCKLSLLVAAMAVLASCKKEPAGSSGYGDVTDSRNARVPDGFDYNTSRKIAFDFVLNPTWGKEKVRLDLYDNLPTAGGTILASHFFDLNGKASGTVLVPAITQRLFAVVIFPDASSTMTELQATSNTISHSFGPSGKSSKKDVIASPDCTSGCGITKNNYSGWMNAANGGVYCFTGSISGGITAKNGSTVRICGSGSLQLTVESGATVEVVNGANVTISYLNINSNADKVIIYPTATVNVTGWFSPNKSIINHGALTLSNFSLNSGSALENNGTITATGTNYNSVASGASLVNNGTFDISGYLTLNSSGSIENNCKLTIAKDLEINSTLENNGFLEAGQKIKLNSNGVLEYGDGAMSLSNDLHLDGKLEGTGTTALIKISDKLSGNSGGSIEGTLEVCDANGIEGAFAGSFVTPAKAACDVYIPTSACNTEGNGFPAIIDTDNDGVADVADQYPNDPLASGSVAYPASDDFATLAFEDIWPGQGDYDFNDLVVKYNHTLVTNSSNKVVRMESRFVVTAVGGSLKNGLGFQLDVNPAAVASVTGTHYTDNVLVLSSNGTEQNQSLATIIVFDNAKKTFLTSGGVQFFNTVPGEEIQIPDTIDVVVSFSTSQEIEDLGEAPYNPFIFRTDERGREVHLADMTPTSLADVSLFGKSADDSDPSSGKYYKTENNLPWGINVMGEFSYPVEKIDIMEAYNFFDNWAQSGGLQNDEWYYDITGYRNDSRIY